MKVYVVMRSFWLYPSELYKTFDNKESAEKCCEELRTHKDVWAYINEVEVLPF